MIDTKQKVEAAEQQRARAAAERAAAERARVDADRAAYAAGARSRNTVGAVMSTYRIIGAESGRAQPEHHEIPAAILENNPSSVTFLFQRKFAHWSQRGVRMVELERVVTGDPEPAWKVVENIFLPKPGLPPTPTPSALENKTPAVHFVLPHEKSLPEPITPRPPAGRQFVGGRPPAPPEKCSTCDMTHIHNH